MDKNCVQDGAQSEIARSKTSIWDAHEGTMLGGVIQMGVNSRSHIDPCSKLDAFLAL